MGEQLRRKIKKSLQEYLTGTIMFAACYFIMYVLISDLYVSTSRVVLPYRDLNASVMVLHCITSVVLIFIGSIFYILHPSNSLRIFLVAAFAVLTLTYYGYFCAIVTSRRLTFKLLPLFNLVSNGVYSALMLDLGQVGLIGMFYVLRHEFVNFLRRLI